MFNRFIERNESTTPVLLSSRQLTKGNMKHILLFIATVLAAVLPCISRAQEVVPVHLTRLEAFEATTGRVVVKGTEDLGTVTGKTGLAIVKIQEFRDVVGNQRESGLVITVRQSEQLEDTTTVDYEELDPLLKAIDYISKADPNVTSLNHFEAFFTTKAGLRVASYISRRTSTVEASITSQRVNRSKTWINQTQLAEFRILLEQAKSRLDALRNGK